MSANFDGCVCMCCVCSAAKLQAQTSFAHSAELVVAVFCPRWRQYEGCCIHGGTVGPWPRVAGYFRRFEGTYCLHLQVYRFTRIVTENLEVLENEGVLTCSVDQSNTFLRNVGKHRETRRRIPQERNSWSLRCVKFSLAPTLAIWTCGLCVMVLVSGTRHWMSRAVLASSAVKLPGQGHYKKDSLKFHSLLTISVPNVSSSGTREVVNFKGHRQDVSSAWILSQPNLAMPSTTDDS